MRKSVGVKSLSLLLSALMLLGVMWVGFSAAVAAEGDENAPTSYHPYEGYTLGEKPKEDPWFFEAKDYSPAMPFMTSDAQFAAPTVAIEAGSTSATVSWNAVEGATGYVVMPYGVQDGAYVAMDPVPASGTSATLTGLTKNTKIAVQIVAQKDGADLCASSVNEILVLVQEDSYYMVNDGSSLANLSYQWGFQDLTAGSVAVPDGAGLSMKTMPAGTLTFTVDPAIDAAQYEAIVFYADMVMDEEATGYIIEWITDQNDNALTSIPQNKDNGQPSSTFYGISAEDGSRVDFYPEPWEDNVGAIPKGFKGYVVMTLFPQLPTHELTKFDVQWHGYFSNSEACNQGKQIYLDNFMLVSDLDIFLGKSTNRTFAVSGKDLYACDTFNSDTNYLGSAELGVGYTLSYNADEMGMRFGLMDTGSQLLGMSLRYTSAEALNYDLAHALQVADNKNATGKLYYRVLKETASGEKSVVWPTEGEWQSQDVTISNLNPKMPLELVNTDLGAGDSLRLESYFDADSANGGSLTIRIGVPKLTVVNSTVNAKGSTTIYAVRDYYPAIFDVKKKGMSNTHGSTVPLTGRFNFEFIDLTNNEIYFPNSYHDGWHMLLETGGRSGTTYHIESGYFNSQVIENRGTSLRFIVTEDGMATLSTRLDKAGRMRILRNGVKVYPAEDEWANGSGLMAINCEAKAGDEIAIQVVGMPGTGGDLTHNLPTITFVSGNTYNLAGDSVFSALLERPYNGESYTGEYVADPNAVWSFGIFNASDSSVTAVDTYDDTQNKFLYASSIAGAGYHFTQSELIANITGQTNLSISDSKGISLQFTAPEAKFYDFATAMRVVSGSGMLNVRLTQNGEKIWPAEEDWYSFAASAGAVAEIPAQELSMSGGDTLRLEAYASGTTDPVVVSLGSPVARKLATRIASDEGYVSIYTPYAYNPYVEKESSGAYVPLNGRWNYNVLKVSDQSLLAMDRYDEATQLLSNGATGVGVTIADTALTANLKNGYGLSFEFVSPMDGKATISTGAAAASGSFRILKNGEKIYPASGDWAAATEDTVKLEDIELAAGDTITIQGYTSDGSAMNFGLPSILVTGSHKDLNDPNGEAFYATYADPFEGDEYTGSYTQKAGLWEFDTLNGSTFETAPVNMYDSTQSRYMYNKDMEGAGYHFARTALVWADLKTATDGTPYGISLQFTPPREEVTNYDMQSAFQLVNSTTKTAKIHLRVTKNGENIWPTDAEWSEQTIAAGQDLSFPYLEFSAIKGDSIRLEMYATDIMDGETPANDITINMVATKVLVSNTEIFVAKDATARIYQSYNYNPYGTLAYNGVHIPSQSRWNFEVLDVANNEVIPAGEYKRSWNSNLYYRGDYLTGFYITKWDVSSLLKYQNEQPIGLSVNYESPADGEVTISGSPSLYSVDAMTEGATVYFRVRINDETIFPAEGGWEALTKENTRSQFGEYKADLKIGDKVYFEAYVMSADGVSEASANLNFTIPTVMSVENTNPNKEKFSIAGDFTNSYQISPYWSYEYTLDYQNPDFKKMESFNGGWGNLWMVNGMNMGISANRMWIKHSLLNSGKVASIAYTFHNPRDGYLTFSDARINMRNTDKAYIRITKNGETIWPEGSDWLEMTGSANFERTIYEVKAGDIFRFEARLGEDSDDSQWEVDVVWGQTITYSKTDPDSITSTDIYEGVDEQLMALLQKFDSSIQFDVNYLENKWKAENPEIEETPSRPSRPSGGDTIDNSTTIEDDDEDEEQTTDPTQQVVRRKKTYVTSGGIPIWIIVVSAVGAVLLIAAAVTLIILKKKGILFAQALPEAAETAEESGPEDISSSSQTSDTDETQDNKEE